MEHGSLRRELVERNGNYYIVSTIILPINHGTKSEPLWYESYVFHANSKGEITDWAEVTGRRSETKDRIMVIHQILAEKVRNGEIE